MIWKDWNVYQKAILICFVVTLLGFSTFIEAKLRSGNCEPILDPGGSNGPYCTSMVLAIVILPGAIVTAIVISPIVHLFDIRVESTFLLITLVSIFSFVLNSLIVSCCIWLYKRRQTKQQDK